jgi:hypothetical protein
MPRKESQFEMTEELMEKPQTIMLKDSPAGSQNEAVLHKKKI